MSDTTTNTADRMRFPLRLTVPLALLIFVAAATWWSLHVGRQEVIERVQRDAIRNVAWTVTDLEAHVERAYRVRDEEAVHGKMAALGANREFVFAVVCDEDYQVLHSMRVGDIGKPIEEILPTAYQEIPLIGRTSLDAIRQALGGRVAAIGDNHTVVAAYPLILGTRPGELRPNRLGNLVVVHDSTATEAEALGVVTDEAFRFFFLLAIFAAGLGLFFHFGVARRLRRLANVAHQVGAGNMDVRSGLGGSDEVAELSWAVDKMVSDKGRAEKALRESEERYRSLFESTHDLVQSVAPDGQFLFVNPAWKEALGYSTDELEDLVLFDVIHPRDHAHCKELWQRVLAGESQRGFEATFVAKDGNQVIVEGNATGRFVAGELVATHGFFRDITERKQAQAQTAERQSRLEAILNTAADAIITIDEQGVIQTANPASEQLFGYPLSELIGGNIAQLMPTTYAKQHDTNVKNYITTGVRKIIGIGREVEAKRKDGTTFPADLAVSELNAGGQRLFTGIVRDISERRLAEAEQQSLGRILEDSLNEVYVFDAQSLLFMQVNQGARENIGYSLDELRKLTPLDLKPEFTPEQFSQLIEPLRNGEKENVVFETVHRRKGGSLYDVEVHIQLGTFQGTQAFVAFILDTTARKRAEQSLRVQQRALESAVNGIIITDPNQFDNPVVYVNPAALQITGYAEEEVLGRNCRFLQKDQREQDALHEVRAAIKQQRNCRVVLRNFRKDGTPFWNELSISPVRDENGKLTHFVGIQSDITARRDAEEALARVNQELEERVQRRNRQLEAAQEQLVRKEKLATLGQLAGSVAHEIRNPMGVIRNAAYFLEQTQANSDANTTEALGEISRGIANAERIVGELLDYAREPSAETNPFNLREAIDAALRMVRMPASVRVERPDAADLRATGDRGQIERLLANLIQNATHAMPDGGTLTLRCAAANGCVVTEVNDTGVGIDAQQLEKIFDPLFTTKAKGIGLGLALCRRYAELNHGSLAVDSEPGQGSTFRLSLPLAGAESD